MTTSWLSTPANAVWESSLPDELNPFVRFRRLLWSWHRWIETGCSDEDFVALVRSLDESVAAVTGTGFVITPASWVKSLAGGSAGAGGATGADTSAGAAGAVFAKDETSNVGGSHKARHLMGLLLHLAVDAVAQDVRLAIASCGNAALGAATVARAAHRPIDVFIPTWADPKVVAELKRLDATIHVCERRSGESGDPTMLRFQEAVADGALPFGVQATENPWTLDGGRTIGWELADQLGSNEVDDVFIQVGGGALLTSCAIGLLESAALGPLNRVPRVWAVQSENCAPFHRAWTHLPSAPSLDERLVFAEQRHTQLMYPWLNPRSAATGILDDVTYDWLGVARALLLTGGSSVLASETEIEYANQRASAAGYNADHTGTAGYAGLLAAQRQHRISPTAKAAVLITGTRR
ncbi:MAG: pyridoxal-phosphate dependent enzyme [Acidimicrobiia bacterium]|nr:pyridoxal-phosphate dependent enzyme [Acidimicrobiia bacterium]MCY4456472.1 pyridoxal-phosphate dependent enzyme [Acidimicrobiaceae bacterium]